MKYLSDYIINLNELKNNVLKIKSNLKDGVKLCAVVKADAYGLGVETICKQISNLIDYFAVANLGEALKIRTFNKFSNLLILGYVENENFDLCESNDIAISIGSNEQLFKIKNTSLKIHLQINTGLNRYGYRSLVEFKKALKYIENNNLNLDGVYSHFSTKSNNIKNINKQYFRFLQFKNIIKNKKVVFHISNSFATGYLNKYNLDMVRCGFLMYDTNFTKINSKPVLSIKSKLINIFIGKKGDYIGYDRTYKLNSKSKIGVVSIGYADGLDKRLSNNFSVLVNGVYCKIIGNICMDVFMVDLKNLDVKIGDEVVILGNSGNHKITLYDYATKLNTSPYEILLKFNHKRMNLILLNK